MQVCLFFCVSGCLGALLTYLCMCDSYPSTSLFPPPLPLPLSPSFFPPPSFPPPPSPFPSLLPPPSFRCFIPLYAGKTEEALLKAEQCFQAHPNDPLVRANVFKHRTTGSVYICSPVYIRATTCATMPMCLHVWLGKLREMELVRMLLATFSVL